MADKNIIATSVSNALKDALDAYSKAHNVSVADIARKAIAKYIGYTFAAGELESTHRGRPQKYATEAERLAAQKAAREAHRTLVNQLLDAHRKAEKDAAIAALQQSVDRMAAANGTPKDGTTNV